MHKNSHDTFSLHFAWGRAYFLYIFFVAYVGYISTAEEEVSTDLRLPEDVEVLRSELESIKKAWEISRKGFCPVSPDDSRK